MIRTVLARLRGSAAILPHKLDERLQVLASLVNGGLDVGNLAPAVRFPAAQFAEGKTLSLLSTPTKVRAQDARDVAGLRSDHLGVVPMAGATLVAAAVDVIATLGQVGLADYTFEIVAESAAIIDGGANNGRVLATVTVQPVPFKASGHIVLSATSKYATWRGVTYLDVPAAINAGERISVRSAIMEDWFFTPACAVIALPHAA